MRELNALRHAGVTALILVQAKVLLICGAFSFNLYLAIQMLWHCLRWLV